MPTACATAANQAGDDMNDKPGYYTENQLEIAKLLCRLQWFEKREQWVRLLAGEVEDACRKTSSVDAAWRLLVDWEQDNNKP